MRNISTPGCLHTVVSILLFYTGILKKHVFYVPYCLLMHVQVFIIY